MKPYALVGILLATVILTGCALDPDIRFARRVFADLVRGRVSAQEKIDWANFQAVGVDVGATYLSFADGKQRQDYQKVFIENFARGFRQAQGKTNAFVYWRIYEYTSELVVVACDYKGKDKTLLFTIAKDEQPKLVAIQWE